MNDWFNDPDTFYGPEPPEDLPEPVDKSKFEMFLGLPDHQKEQAMDQTFPDMTMDEFFKLVWEIKEGWQ